MNSSWRGAPFELSVQQDLPPAPNGGSQGADWLPRFAGSSWLAYAASSTVVVATAPSPLNPGETASGRFFQQVLETGTGVDEVCCGEVSNAVTSVGWAPMGPSVGQLAAATGKYIHIYYPTRLSMVSKSHSQWPEIPLAWEAKQTLQHTFQVVTFAWTDSGDGLLSAGAHVTMWKGGGKGFSILWQVQCTVPQALAASSWSFGGVVATADEKSNTKLIHNLEDETVVEETSESLNTKATVWWWEDGLDVKAIELAHPSAVSMIQWRPSNGSGEDSYTFRPVLLTCSSDGTVRLWLDMEGPSYSSFSFGDNQDQKKKPLFSMGAVIEVTNCLHGILGQDIFVTWASESRVRGGHSEDSRSNSTDKMARRRELTPCEWMVGVDIDGKIVLWSIHSLDDILPTRPPRVSLWQQGGEILTQPSLQSWSQGEISDKAIGRLMMKAVVQRPEGTLAVPPSSLDLFEVLPSGLFRWSRVWPPVSAIGTGGGHVGTGIQSTGNKSAWGVSSEVIILDGHRGVIVQVAMHPSTRVGLAASIDDKGVVLLWDLSGWSSPQVKVMSSQTLGWKLAGRLSSLPSILPSNHLIFWAPISLTGGRSILLVGDGLKIDCFLVSRTLSQGKGENLVLSDHLHTLHCPAFDSKQQLEGFGAVPVPLDDLQQGANGRRFIVIGTGGGGVVLASWLVELQETSTTNNTNKHQCAPVKQGSELKNGEAVKIRSQENVSNFDPKSQCHQETGFIRYAGPLAAQQEGIYIKDNLIGFVELGAKQHVTSLAVVPGSIKGSLSSDEEVYQNVRPYDLLTGCSDGGIRLYKVSPQESTTSHFSVSESRWFTWQCVGVVWTDSGSVTRVSLTAGGDKFASVGDAGNDAVVKIWEVESYNESGDFELKGQLTLPQPIVALSWLDVGTGTVLLGVATRAELGVYIQSRWSSQKNVPQSTVWNQLASFSVDSVPNNLLWSCQGSPILTSKGHLRVFSPWVYPKLGSSLVGSTNGSMATLAFGSDRDPALEGSLQTDVCGSRNLIQIAEDFVCPLADYHPRALLWCLFKGHKSRARACIRHLAHHLAATSPTSISKDGAPLVSDKIGIPRMDLTNLLQKEVPMSTQLSGQEFSSYSNSFNFMDTRVGQSTVSNTSDKYSFLNNTSWLDEFASELSDTKAVRGSQSHEALKMGGVDPFLKSELKAILDIIDSCSSVPQLSKDEQKQLLAVVELMGEMDGIGQVVQCTGLDHSGQRYWLAYRYAKLFASQLGEKEGVHEFMMESKTLAWALQSDTKESLLDACASEQSTWPELRALGVGFWFTDAVPLRKKMEKVARAQYMANKDAKESALLYIALERRTVLAGLLKISKDERDRPLVDFLARDFQEEKHQAAALKNAYVLMGKHRHELAAAFFVLGGDIDSAVSVCSKNLGDPQLGLVLCRLIEGSDGPIGQNIIRKHVLPAASKAGDYWLASLCQWLLGHGVETMHEVIHGCRPSVRMQPSSEKQIEAGCIGGSIPLDPDVGDYCAVLALKPRLRGDFQKGEVAGILRQTTMRASLALRRVGLPLQALEHMTASCGSLMPSHMNMSNAGCEDLSSAVETPATNGFKLQLSKFDHSQNESVAANWILPKVLAEVQIIARNYLALQCMSQLIHEQPEWDTAQKPPVSSLSNVHETANSPEGQNRAEIESIEIVDGIRKGFDSMEEAAKKVEEGLEVLRTTFSLEVSDIVAGLVMWVRNQHHLYMYSRLQSAQCALLQSSEQVFNLSSKADVSLRVDIMGAIWKEAPWALARIILACGSSVTSAKKNSQLPRLKSVMPWEQIQELVRYGGELQRLAGLVNRNPGSGESQSSAGVEDLKGKTERAMILLAYVYYVGAAWLGRNGKALVALVGPTISDPTRPPEVPPTNISSVKWFEDLCHKHDQGEKILTSIQNSGDVDTIVVSEEETWRVTSVALWVHILSYVKKQLAGTGKETAYSGFGRVSVPQVPSKSSSPFLSTAPFSSSQVLPSSSSNRLVATFMGLGLQSISSVSTTAWSEIKNKMRDDTPAISKATSSVPRAQDVIPVPETPRSSRNYEDLYVSLLSSIACTSTGLQQQLAAHLQHLLEVETSRNHLVLWLWGKLLQSKTSGSAMDDTRPSALTAGTPATFRANGSGGRPLSVVYPVTVLEGDDEASKELWRLLVVRDTIRSALAMEGVNGPSQRTVKSKRSGWRGAKNRSALLTAAGVNDIQEASSSRIIQVADQVLSRGFAQDAGSQGSDVDERQLPAFQNPEVLYSLSGELIEAFCVNSCNPDQVVLATNRKGLLYLDLVTHGTFTETSESMLEQVDYPRNTWAGPVATPGSGLKAQRSSGVGVGVGSSAVVAPPKVGKEAVKVGGVSFGMPGYGGMGAWGGWEEWEDADSYVDPIATVDNVSTKALAAHPSQPLFLVGSNNTHVYLWEYGKPSATATYGVLPAANMPPPYVIASVASVRFDSGGHRFVTAAMDGTVSTWQLEVGGRSNVRPTESCLFFGTHASEATFVVGSSSLVAATGMTNTCSNLIVWDTLAPPSSSRQSIPCHEGGARCIASLDIGVGGGSNSPWIVSGGKGGDVAVHDFRYILSTKAKRPQGTDQGQRSPLSSGPRVGVGEVGQNGMLWHLPKAHSGSVTKAAAVPGTSYFFTGSKDGDVKLWDVSTRSMVGHWLKVHERHTFLQVNSRSLGSIIQQAAVTDVQPTVDGFLTCGGDGTVKLFRHLH